MLPAKYRLQLRRTLPFYLFEHKAHVEALSFYWRKTAEPQAAQAAVVVPKKVAKTAVLRNRIKRVLRAQLQLLLPTLPAGLQFVIVVRRVDITEHLPEVVRTIQEKVR